MKKLLLSFLALSLVIGVAVHAALPEQNSAGTVTKIKGSVIAVQNAQVRPLGLNDTILIGDILSTGADSRLEITMIDEGLFSLGALTSFVVIDYTFGQDGEGNAVLDLLKGAVDGVSGQIAKFDDGKGMRITTQQATIGIRGTKFFIGEFDNKLQVAHWEGGGVHVKNHGGEVIIEDDNHGVELTHEHIAPTDPEKWHGEKKERAKALIEH